MSDSVEDKDVLPGAQLNYNHGYTFMAKAAIPVIVFGACLFVLGMMPDAIATFHQELRSLRDNFCLPREPIYGIQTDSAQVWLVVGGGVMMIVGLLILVLS